MKIIYLITALIFGGIELHAQVAGDFRSRSNGTWTDFTNTTPWEQYDGVSWNTATTLPNLSNDVTIQNGHTIILPLQGIKQCKNLSVDLGGKLFTNNSTLTNVYTLSLYGNIICDGTIGNGTTYDDIAFNIKGNTAISGNGAFDCTRLRQDTNLTCTIIIDININFRYGGTCIYNDGTSQAAKLNLTINSGVIVNIIGDGITPGNICIDGLSGVGPNVSGNITVNGTLLVSGTTYFTTNNATQTPVPVSFTIGSTGILATNIINAATSRSSGHTLTINNGGVLRITGDNTVGFTHPSTDSNTYILASGSTIEYSRAGNQTIYDFGVNYKNLKLSGSGSKALDSAINIDESLEVVGASSLVTNGNSITLKSTSSQTASVKNITSSANPAISGDVTVERYIGNLTTPKRAWRLLAAPLSATGAPTILNSWQEGSAGANPNSGFGTWITRPGGAPITNGFDANSGGTSIQCWNGTNLVTPSNTNITKITDSGGAWFLFVRGDKSITGSGVSGNTILRMTGTLNQGNITTGKAGVTAADFSLIPNPYASPVDYEAIVTNAGNAGVGNIFYVWDANLNTLGGYRAVERTSPNNYEQTPSGGSPVIDNTARYIRSGQAFFLPTQTTVNFTEGMKTTSIPSFNVFKTTTGTEELIVNLKKVTANDTVLVDGVRMKYDNNFSNNIVTGEDVLKMQNVNEVFAIYNDSTRLSVDKRAFFAATDTIQFKFNNTQLANYQLEITPNNFSNTATAYLIDNYTNTATALSNTSSTTYSFTITSATGSWDQYRFMIVLLSNNPLFVKDIRLAGTITNNTAALYWTAVNEEEVTKYELQRSADKKHFTTIFTTETKANTGKDVVYEYADKNLKSSSYLYRVKCIVKDNAVVYSNIISLEVSCMVSSIMIYPNPVVNGDVSLSLNNLQDGVYQITVYATNGQLMQTETVPVNSAAAQYHIKLKKSVVSGIYQMVIKGNGINNQQQFIVK